MSKYLRKAERCVCEFFVAIIDHQIPLLSLNEDKIGTKGRKEEVFELGNTLPPLLQNIISRIEYQAIF